MAPIFPSRITRQNPTPPFSIGWFKTASALPVGTDNIPGWGRCILPPPIRCNSPSRATRRTPGWDGENFGLPSGRFPSKYICIPVFRRIEPEIREVFLVEIESEMPRPVSILPCISGKRESYFFFIYNSQAFRSPAEISSGFSIQSRSGGERTACRIFDAPSNRSAR